VAWYDRHFDAEWQDVLLAPPDAQGARAPWAYALPRSAQDLRAMGKSFSATTFLSAGNITHTPAYGNLIALGILDAAEQRNVSPEQIENAARHRERIVRTGRFLTFSAGAATIGSRMRPGPAERVPLKLVRETDAGLIVRGKVGMHTTPVYAEDVYIGAHGAIDRGPHRATFTVPVGAPGVTVICRKTAARHPNPFLSPLSSRFDELDGQMWLGPRPPPPQTAPPLSVSRAPASPAPPARRVPPRSRRAGPPRVRGAGREIGRGRRPRRWGARFFGGGRPRAAGPGAHVRQEAALPGNEPVAQPHLPVQLVETARQRR